MSVLNPGKNSPNSPSGETTSGGSSRIRARAALVAGLALVVPSIVAMTFATSASASTAITTVVTWVMDNTPAGGPNTPTYKQHLQGSSNAATCGHKEQIDRYRYDDQPNSAIPSETNKQYVDNLLAGGVLDNRPHHGPYDSSVFLSVKYADQPACQSSSPPPPPDNTGGVTDCVGGKYTASVDLYNVVPNAPAFMAAFAGGKEFDAPFKTADDSGHYVNLFTFQPAAGTISVEVKVSPPSSSGQKTYFDETFEVKACPGGGQTTTPAPPSSSVPATTSAPPSSSVPATTSAPPSSSGSTTPGGSTSGSTTHGAANTATAPPSALAHTGQSGLGGLVLAAIAAAIVAGVAAWRRRPRWLFGRHS